MPDLEDDLKLSNWLSIVTFDVFKYVKAGGKVQVEWSADGLTLHLADVTPDSDGLNAKFRRHIMAAPMVTPPAPQEEQP
jgi:hypothetical protein